MQWYRTTMGFVWLVSGDDCWRVWLDSGESIASGLSGIEIAKTHVQIPTPPNSADIIRRIECDLLLGIMGN